MFLNQMKHEVPDTGIHKSFKRFSWSSCYGGFDKQVGERRSSRQFLSKADEVKGKTLSSRRRKGAVSNEERLLKEKWQTGKCVCILTHVKALTWSSSSRAHHALCSFPAGLSPWPVVHNRILSVRCICCHLLACSN